MYTEYALQLPGLMFAEAAARYKLLLLLAFSLVPLAGIEPALLAELDFESSASTNSATGASARSGRPDVAKRAEYSGRARWVNPSLLIPHVSRFEAYRFAFAGFSCRGISWVTGVWRARSCAPASAGPKHPSVIAGCLDSAGCAG